MRSAKLVTYSVTSTGVTTPNRRYADAIVSPRTVQDDRGSGRPAGWPNVKCNPRGTMRLERLLHGIRAGFDRPMCPGCGFADWEIVSPGFSIEGAHPISVAIISPWACSCGSRGSYFVASASQWLIADVAESTLGYAERRLEGRTRQASLGLSLPTSELTLLRPTPPTA
jgi:hypothetical protein